MLIRTMGAVSGMLAVLMLAGCGHFVAPQDYRIQPYQGISPHDSDQAVVVFLWPQRKTWVSDAFTLAVLHNEAVIGALQRGTYFSRIIEPGPHQFAVDSGLIDKSREQVALTAKPGQTYFVSYTPGGFQVVAKLDLIAEDVALAQLPGLSTIQLTSR